MEDILKVNISKELLCEIFNTSDICIHCINHDKNTLDVSATFLWKGIKEINIYELEQKLLEEKIQRNKMNIETLKGNPTDMTLDDIYGCNITEYLKYHNKTKEDLISEITIDIEILIKSHKRYVDYKDELELDDLMRSTVIQNLIEKKRLHLKRIINWND